jgi:hypothetical protein
MRPEWEEAVTRALTDRRFRARLLGDPVEALRAYGLEPRQAHLLNDLCAQTLDQLITRLRRIHWLPAVIADEGLPHES